MLPNRPANEGPLARSAREAFESAVSEDVAAALLSDALVRADLSTVPEGVEAFSRFCSGPLRAAMHASLSVAAIEQVLERLGHVLWMASGDPGALERARTWGTPQAERDGDSGVRHLDMRHAVTEPAMTATRDSSDSRPRSSSDSRPRDGSSDSRPRTSTPDAHARDTRATPARDWASQPREHVTDRGLDRGERTVSGSQPKLPAIGSGSQPRLPAAPVPPVSGTAVTLGRMRAMSGRMPAVVEQGPSADRISEPSSEPGVHRTSDPGAMRPGSSPRSRSHLGPSASSPTAVLALTLDEGLLSQLRTGLAMHCPVRPIVAPPELAGALVTSGDRIVVLIDTALPSIDVRTFAGLAPILPPNTRVVLFGATEWQRERLAAMVPAATSWVLGPTDAPLVPFLLSLPPL